MTHLSGNFEMKPSAFAAFAASTTSSFVASVALRVVIRR